jgi:hypothetical protein
MPSSKSPPYALGLSRSPAQSLSPSAVGLVPARPVPSTARLPPSPPTRMRLFQLTYDMRPKGEDYVPMWNWLELMNGLRIQQSVWWVPYSGHAVELRDVAMSLMDSDDSVSVVEMSGQFAGYESRPEVRRWIEWYIRSYT